MLKRLFYSLMLIAVAFPAAAQNLSPAGTEADHAALRDLKTALVTAINKQDFDGIRRFVHEPMLATAITQDSFVGVGSLADYFKALFTRGTLRIKSIQITGEADELSQIYTGTFAVARGSSRETYELADGRKFEMAGRWTATSVKEPDGQWKVLAIHDGANFLDNPVVLAIERSIPTIAAGAGGAGLVAGFLAGWLISRGRRSASPA
ncbi:MAG: DUF4440 domain-containing protein [Bauldia sp.]